MSSPVVFVSEALRSSGRAMVMTLVSDKHKNGNAERYPINCLRNPPGNTFEPKQLSEGHGKKSNVWQKIFPRAGALSPTPQLNQPKNEGGARQHDRSRPTFGAI